MAVELRPIHESGIADDPAAAVAGFVLPSEYNVGVKLTGGSNGQVLVQDSTKPSGMDLTSNVPAQSIRFLNTEPASPQDGDCWIKRQGASPNRQIILKFQDGAETVELLFSER